MSKTLRDNGEGRGKLKLIVVPDSCTMDLATAVIPEHFFKEKFPEQKRPRTVYDIYLDHLPKQKVGSAHMLDIVAAELFGVKANGTVYDQQQFDAVKSKQPELYRLYRRIFTRKDANISVVETTQGAALINAFSGIKELEGLIGTYLDTLPKDDKTREKTRDIRKEMRSLHRVLGSDRGEKIIADYLMKHENPTFFVSDDKKGRAQAIAAGEQNNRACVYVDNSVGFLTVLKNAGVFARCGLNDWVTPEILVKEMYAQKHQRLNSKSSEDPTYLNPTLQTITGKGPGTRKENPPPEKWFDR